MAVATALPHIEAVRDLLETQLPAPIAVGVGSGAGIASPKVVLYPDAGADESSTLIPHTDLVVFFPLHIVSEQGWEQGVWTADRVREVLIGAVPMVAGRAAHPMWQEQAPRPLDRDDDVQPPTWTFFAEYGLRTTPA